tara:strand:+ start:920 stop:1306 length:387 start_codon:yes stop_codon:yes gene_type:complete
MSQNTQHPTNEAGPVGGVRSMWILVIDTRNAGECGEYAFDIVNDAANNRIARNLLGMLSENPEQRKYCNVGVGGNDEGLVPPNSDNPEDDMEQIIDYFDSKFCPSNEYNPSNHLTGSPIQKYISLVEC